MARQQEMRLLTTSPEKARTNRRKVETLQARASSSRPQASNPLPAVRANPMATDRVSRQEVNPAINQHKDPSAAGPIEAVAPTPAVPVVNSSETSIAF